MTRKGNVTFGPCRARPLALILHDDQNQLCRLPLPSRDYPTGDLDLALEYRVVGRRRNLVRPNARLGRGRFGKLLRTIGISFFQDETPFVTRVKRLVSRRQQCADVFRKRALALWMSETTQEPTQPSPRYVASSLPTTVRSKRQDSAVSGDHRK
jgi:hypothetical protein